MCSFESKIQINRAEKESRQAAHKTGTTEVAALASIRLGSMKQVVKQEARISLNKVSTLVS